MNEGRAELQRVILQYEKQRAEAIRSKQECEIVLPFMRAALEELDAALGQSENGDVIERVQSQVASGKARSQQIQAETHVEPAAPVEVVEPEPVVETAPEPVAELEPEPERPAFSLMNSDEMHEANEDSEPVEEAADEPEEKKDSPFPSFNRASIASLIDEAGKKESAG